MSQLRDEKLQAKREARLSDRRYRELQDLKVILQAPEGRRFIHRLLDEITNTFGGSFPPKNPEALQLSFNEGQRDVGISVMTDCQEASVDDYWLMLQEAWSANLHDEDTEEEEAKASTANEEI